MNAKLNLSPEERKLHKAAIKKKSYHARKNDPGRQEAVNKANLARYYLNVEKPGFMEAMNARQKDYYDASKDDPEYMKAIGEKYRRNALKRMWDGITRHAIKRAIVKGLPYDPNLLEWAASIWTGRCALSGIEFRRNVGMGPGPFSPSIDRIIPALGYVPGNCRFILHALNAMKGSGTDEEMLLIARAFVAAQ